MPLPPLLLIFIGLPILELVLLFEVHGIVGFLPTVLLVFATGIVGATLVRQQGIQTLFNIRQELALGNLPAPPNDRRYNDSNLRRLPHYTRLTHRYPRLCPLDSHRAYAYS